MKALFLAASLCIGTSANAQTRAPDFGRDWPKEVAKWGSAKPLENQRTLGATPISNLPFLKVRPGDRLVEGQERWHNGKAGTDELLARRVYLWHGGKRFELDTQWKGQSLVWREVEKAHLFAWTFSPDNATALFALRSRFELIPVSPGQWRELKARLQKEWPASLRDDFTLSLAPPRFQNESATFEELLYDNWDNRLLFRRTSIGTKGMWSKDWFLAVGPHRVDEEETRERRGGINGPRGFLPGELERNRRDYARQQEFRALIGEVLPSVKPTKALPENDMALRVSPAT